MAKVPSGWVVTPPPPPLTTAKTILPEGWTRGSPSEEDEDVARSLGTTTIERPLTQPTLDLTRPASRSLAEGRRAAEESRQFTTEEDSWAEIGAKFFQNLDDRAATWIGGLAQATSEIERANLGVVAQTTPFGNLLGPLIKAIPFDEANRPVIEFGERTSARAREELERNRPIGRTTPDAIGQPALDPTETLKGYAYDIANSMTDLAAAVAVSAATRTPQAGVAMIGAQAFGQQFDESRTMGRTSEQAFGDASFMAAAEMIGEQVPLGILMKPGQKFLSRTLKGAAAEGVQEIVTQVLQTGYDKGILHPDMTWGEAARQVRRAGIIGFAAGGGVAVASAPFMRGTEAPLSPEADALLTPEDRVSALPDSLIAAGKAKIDEILGRPFLGILPPPPSPPGAYAPPIPDAPTRTEPEPRLAPAPRAREATPAPVADGRAVAAELFPDARITSGYRGPDHPLSRANPRSWHTQSHAAVDMAPIPGMTFEQARQRFEDAGYTLIEALNETGKGKTKHATGDHWHFVLGQGGAAAPAESAAALGITPDSTPEASAAAPRESAAEMVERVLGEDILNPKEGERVEVTRGGQTVPGVIESVWNDEGAQGVRIKQDDGAVFDEALDDAREAGVRITRPVVDQPRDTSSVVARETPGDDTQGPYIVTPIDSESDDGTPYRNYQSRDEAGNITEYGQIYSDGPVTRFNAKGEALPVSREFADERRGQVDRRAEPREGEDRREAEPANENTPVNLLDRARVLTDKLTGGKPNLREVRSEEEILQRATRAYENVVQQRREKEPGVADEDIIGFDEFLGDWRQYEENGADATMNDMLGNQPDSTPDGTLGQSGQAAPTIEDTPSGKGLIVNGATEAQLAAVSAAVPKAKAVPGKSGVLYSKKYEAQIREALAQPQDTASTVEAVPEESAKSVGKPQPGSREAGDEVIQRRLAEAKFNVARQRAPGETTDGAAAFRAGEPRMAPRDLSARGKKAWLRDWDRENIAAPVPEPVKPITPGQRDYEEAIATTPVYQDGSPRPPWDKLGAVEQRSWEKSALPEPETPTAEPSRFAKNKLFTEDKVEAARARLKSKMGRLQSGVDPETLVDGMTIAGAYIEAGVRNFAEFAKQMTADFGDNIKPFLLSFWEGARNYPGLPTEGMTPPDASRAMHDMLLAGMDSELSPSRGIDSIEEVPDAQLSDSVPDSDAGAGAEDVPRTAERAGRARPASRREDEGGADDVRAADEGRQDAPERSAGGPVAGAERDGASVLDADRVPEREAGSRVAPEAVKGSDWIIEPGSLDESRSPAQKARDNVAAIEIVKRLKVEGRPATREEQAALAKYVGWGGLKNAFPDLRGQYGKGFEAIGPRLRELLTDEEYETAKRSIQWAHYTGETVVRAMWQIAERLGFRGGTVFEPGMGTGNFRGMMPGHIAAESQYSGIEYDHLTADIAKALYPQSGVRQADYTKIPRMLDAVDLVIGNPPFAETAISNDKDYGHHKFLIHDFFFAKAIDAVKPGGLLMFVTSAGTLNKSDSKARVYLAERADLVGAIRLPGGTFENAGASVTTDIVILRRRLPGEEATNNKWMGTARTKMPDRSGEMIDGSVNWYFADNPEMILGEQGMFEQSATGLRYGVRAPEGFDLGDALAKAMANLPRDVVPAKAAGPVTTGAQPAWRTADYDLDSGERKEGSYYLADGKLMQYRDGVGRPVQAPGKGVTSGISAAAQERIRGLIPVRDALRKVYAADLKADEAAASAARADLNAMYDRFVGKFGPINKSEITYRAPTSVMIESARAEAREEARLAGRAWDEGSFNIQPLLDDNASIMEMARARKADRERYLAAGREWDEGSFDPEDVPEQVIEKHPNLDPFRADEESYRLAAIEHYNKETGEAVKGRAFYESALKLDAEPKINSSQDALLYSLNQRGFPDIDLIAEMAGKSRDAVLDDLASKLFAVPGHEGRYETAEIYLSGNVREKLAVAEAEAARDPSLQPNVEALRAVQPRPLTPTEISANLGMPWIPPPVVKRFATERLGLSAATVTYLPKLARWSARGDTTSSAARSTWGTARADALTLLEGALNRQAVKIYDTIRTMDGEKRVLNEVDTQAAQDKQNEIKQAFRDWIWTDETRTGELVDLYNREYNSLVAPKFDGSYLTTPGISSGWTWRPHQRGVVSRIIQSGNTYMAHEVGAGKTSAMIGAGMEMKRLGLVNKPMYVVPNHMLGQFTKEFYEQYPLARIKVADEQRFHTLRRKSFVAQVAAEDLDAIIITHSAFGYIPMSDEFTDAMISDEIADLEDMLREIDKTDRVTRRNVEQQKQALEQKLTGKKKKRPDQVFTFEEMGVDFLFVDEAHLFRKLSFATKMSNVKGVDPNGSQASFDVYAKTRYLESLRPGRSVVLASGTPITNTMAELYSVSRYLQQRELEKRGLGHFDAWAGAFGETVTALEQNAAGGYDSQTRFAKFVNVPELSVMVRQVMDVVGAAELRQYVSLPTLKGGQRNMIVAEQTPEQAAYQDTLKTRIEKIRARTGTPKKGDDILLSVIGDGRKNAIDYRLVDPTAGKDEGSKLELLIANVFDIWQRTKRQPFHDPLPEGRGYSEKPVDFGPATQMIFADLGINGAFPVHKYIKQSLIALGVPEKQVAIISDYKTSVARQRLFNDMNEGKVRVLIGSVQKMGTGVNAQQRLYALHNQDPQWYPANDTQRVGRGMRQGNRNPEIEVHDYSTHGTYDSQMWALMAKKARFIEGFMRGDPDLRDMEDLGEASQYEQAQALTTADPRIMDLTEWKQELEKVERRRMAHERGQQDIRLNIAGAKLAIENAQKAIPLIEQDIAKREPATDEVRFSGTAYEDKAAFGEALMGMLDAALARFGNRGVETIGSYRGFTLRAEVAPSYSGSAPFIVIARSGDRESVIRPGDSARGLVTRIDNALAGFEEELAQAQDSIARSERTVADFTPQLGQTFDDGGRAAELSAKIGQLEATLEAESKVAKGEALPRAQRIRHAEPGTFAGREEEVRAELLRVLERFGIADRILLNVVGNLGPGRENISALSLNGVISIATEKTSNPGSSLAHETIHAMRDMGLFTPAEWRALTNDAWKNPRVRKLIERHYGGAGLSVADLKEEAAAVLFDEYWRDARAPSGTLWSRAMKRILQFIAAVGRAIGADTTAFEARLVKNKIISGEIGAREIGSGMEGRDVFAPQEAPEAARAQRGGQAEPMMTDEELRALARSDDPRKREKFEEERARRDAAWTPRKAVPAERLPREKLRFSDTPEPKYIRFGDIPEDERSRVGALPNVYAAMAGVRVGDKHEGVSVYKVSYNAERNLWQIDDSELSEGGFASADELLASQDEIDDRMVSGGHYRDAKGNTVGWVPPVFESVKNEGIRPLYLVTGDEVGEGIDGEPVLRNVRILDRIGVQDVLHEGYFDPDEDLSPERNPSVFSRSSEPGARYQRRMADPDAEADMVDLAGADPTWRGTMATAFERFRTAMQDRYLPLLKVQRSIERQTGKALPPRLNPYLGEELMAGRIGSRLDILADKQVAPLFDAMHAEKVSLEELETYLYARHAPERNKRMSEINPAMEGNGSGMSDIQAAAVMSRIEKAGKTAAMERLAARVDEIRDAALDYRIETGLISQKEADAWRETYEHYVPLRGFAEVGEGDPGAADRINRSGGGINVKGRESKAAFGRRSKADSPLAYLILQAQEAIVRGETNRVAQRFVKLAEERPDPEFWKVQKATHRRRLNKDTGLVEDYITHNLTAEDAKWTVTAKFDGKERRVTMNRQNPAARRLADSMRNLTQDQFAWVTLHLGKLNRFLSAVNTKWNIDFILPNAIRDLQTAAINMGGIDVENLASKALAHYPGALKAATKGAFNKGSGEWGKWYDEFVLEGGKVAFNHVEDINVLKKRIESAFAMSAARAGEGNTLLQAKRAAIAVRDTVDNLNSGVENAIRLAAFRAARESGVGKEQAASIAKNLTVNFNRRGQLGPWLNSLYLFYNAGVQGSVRIIQASRSPKVRKMLAGIVIAGFMVEMLNSLVSDDDDDGESFYDKIPAYEKSRNIIIMLGGSEYLKLPTPYGYNVFWEAGRSIAEVGRRGGDRWQESAGNWLTTVADSFNPIGGADSLLNLISPTVSDPIVDLTLNRDFAGNPIMPDDNPFEPDEPDAQRYWGSVGTHWKTVTDFLTEATGGSTVEPGAVDVSPETLEYLAGTVFGAAGATLDRVISIPSKAASGELEISDIPVARKVTGAVPSWHDKSAFYDRLAEVEQQVDDAKDYLEAGNIEAAQEFVEDKERVLSLEGTAKQARKDMREIRKARRANEDAKEKKLIDRAAYEAEDKVIDEAEDIVIREFNTAWNRTLYPE